MIGIIYYKSREEGQKQFFKIINKYEEYYSIKPKSPFGIKVSKSQCAVYFENGDIWKTVQCGNGARGNRWNIAYIERTISQKERQLYIYPYGLEYIWCATNEY